MRIKQIVSKIPLCLLLILFQAISPLHALSKEIDVFSLSIEELMNIAIATKTEMTTEEAPSIVSVISSKEIMNMGARNLVDVLRTVPGFDLTDSTTVNAKKIGVRGISAQFSSKTKFMVDGHTISVAYYLGCAHLLDNFPLANIKRIEIIRGPGSALYGAGAFTSVINIITKEGGDEPSSIGFTGGSYNSYKPYAELSYNNNDFKAYAYLDYYETDGYDGKVEEDMGTLAGLPGGAPGKLTSGKEYHTLQAKLNFKNCYLSGFVQDVEMESPIGAALMLTDETEETFINYFTELGYKSPIGDETGNINFKAYYDYSVAESVYELFPEESAQFFNQLAETGGLSEMYLPFPEGEGVYGSPRTKGSTTGVEITFDYNTRPGIQFVAGAAYEYTELRAKHYANTNFTGNDLEVNGIIYPAEPKVYLGGLVDISENGNFFSIEKPDRTISATYVQGTFDLKELFSIDNAQNMAVTAGIRYDDYDDVGSTTNPRIGLVYGPSEKLYFKLLYGTAFRAPTFLELYDQNNPALLGNPKLEPEKITTIEALVWYHFTKSLRGGLTFFSISAEELIQTTVTTGASSNTLVVNAGDVVSKGLEAEMKLIFDQSKYAYINFTYQDVTNTTNEPIEGTNLLQDDFFPGNVPEILGNMGVNYGFTEDILFNISLNYIGERGRSDAMMWDGTSLVKSDQRDPIDSVFLLNASLSFNNLISSRFNVRISGFNLLDQDHRDPEETGQVKNDVPLPGTTGEVKIFYIF